MTWSWSAASASWPTRQPVGQGAYLHGGPPDSEGLPEAEAQEDECEEQNEDPVLDVQDEPAVWAIWNEAAEAVAKREAVAAVSSNTALVLSHQLRRAPVHEPGYGACTYCLLCGAYCWTQHGSLLKPCRGPVKGLNTQRDMIKAGRFPHPMQELGAGA